MPRLQGDILKVAELKNCQVDAMFRLFSAYYDNVTQDKFVSDLNEKAWVVLLRDDLSEQIRGFSTQMLLSAEVEGIKMKAIFSGDTIIHQDFWGEPTLARVWLNSFLSLAGMHKENKLYWFLISMGYRTYRFLPVYFKNFYPRYDREMPEFDKKVLDSLAAQKYPAEYDPKAGIVKHVIPKEKLKSGVAEVSEAKLRNPHTAFFLKKNPGYWAGDELACLALIDENNLNPIAFRVMGRKKP